MQPGHFSFSIEKVVDSYECATALGLAPPNRHLEQRTGALNILVPTTGADYSRRALEVAIVLAKVCGGELTVLHVTPAVQGVLSRLETTMKLRRPATTEQPSVENVKALGKRYGVSVSPRVIEGLTVEDAVLSQVKRRNHDLIVLGAKEWPAEGLFFGHKSSVILEQTPGSCLAISS